MRPITPRTLLALAIGITTASGLTLAGDGPDGRAGNAPPCADHRLSHLTDRLNLDPEQQAKVKTILKETETAAKRLREESRKQIEGLLTETQRAELDQGMQIRLTRRADRLAKRLNLSPEQETQVQAILDEQRTNPDLTRAQVRERIATVLTPEQQRDFDTLGPHHGPGRHGCRPLGQGPEGGPPYNPEARPNP